VFCNENLTKFLIVAAILILVCQTYISLDGVESLLKSVDVKKATGPDGVPGRILKLCATEITPVLAIIFNQSLLPKD